MKEKLQQISVLAKEIMQQIDELKVKSSNKSSMRTQCQSILDEAYIMTMEIDKWNARD